MCVCSQPRWWDLPGPVLPADRLLYFRGSSRNGFSGGEHPSGQAGSGHLRRRLWEVWTARLGCSLKVRVYSSFFFPSFITVEPVFFFNEAGNRDSAKYTVSWPRVKTGSLGISSMYNEQLKTDFYLLIFLLQLASLFGHVDAHYYINSRSFQSTFSSNVVCVLLL